jgi:uncharacterized protein
MSAGASNICGMDFGQLTVVLLVLRPDAPELDDAASDALQDAHMAHLAQLHDDGYLVAAGPLLGGPQEPLRGLSLLRVDPERARELKEADPAVRAGRYSVKILPWMVPGGAVAFSRTRFPRSMAEARGD